MTPQQIICFLLKRGCHYLFTCAHVHSFVLRKETRLHGRASTHGTICHRINPIPASDKTKVMVCAIPSVGWYI